MSKLRPVFAREGYTLTKDGVYSKEIYLGCNDKAENWTEITDAEAEERTAAMFPTDEAQHIAKHLY